MTNILVLGANCTKCKTLEKLTRQAVDELGMDAQITKVEDIVEILKYSILSTPALVVDDEVVLRGRVPSLVELKEILSKQ